MGKRYEPMSCEELRYWLKRLHTQHGWSWGCLGRLTGLGTGDHVASKVRGNSHFVRGEQRRTSRLLDRIISGELVPVQRRVRGSFATDAVVAEHPRPLQLGTRMRFDLMTGRIMRTRPRPPPDSPLPGFATAFQNAENWGWD